jgi:phosphonate transport system substrate-binding protein
VFQDIRVQMKDVPDAVAKTRVLKFTANIPNDTISVRSDMDANYRKKLQDAFIAIGKDPEGKKIIGEVYSHQGYVASDDKKFDIVREYAKQVGQK